MTDPTPLPVQKHPLLHAPPISTHGHAERHLGLLDLVTVGVGGTLGSGFFLLCVLLMSTYVGPSSALCWLLSVAPALLSGFCFAELAGEIPAAGLMCAYVYTSMEDLPAVLAVGCLSLEYLVSASAIARGWGDKMVVWALAPPLWTGSVWLDGSFVGDDGTMTYHDGSSHWATRLLRPGWNFNPLAFLLAAPALMMRVATWQAHSHCRGCYRMIR